MCRPGVNGRVGGARGRVFGVPQARPLWPAIAGIRRRLRLRLRAGIVGRLSFCSRFGRRRGEGRGSRRCVPKRGLGTRRKDRGNSMIELVPAELDDVAFLSLVQRIVNGAISSLQVREVYLVHIDNWFDHKWLGWWSSWKHKELKVLYVPPFNPNRVRSQKHFLWDGNSSRWTLTGQGKNLHLRQPG